MKKGILLICVFGALFSCQREKLDFNKLDNLTLSPDLSLPLVKTTLGLGDLVKDDSILQVNSDNSLSIVYFTDSLFGFKAGQLVEIPAQDEIEVPLPVGATLPPASFSLGTLAGMKLFTAQFDEGYFKVGAKSDVPAPSNIDFKITIYTADNNGAVLEVPYTLPAGQTEVYDSIDISSFTFDFDGPNDDLVNNISFGAEIVNAGSANAGDIFKVSMQFTRLTVGDVRGDFGNRKFNIPSGGFDFDISGLDEFANGFYLANPELKLIYRSNIGAGIELKPNFNGMNKEKILTALKINSPLAVDGATSSSVLNVDTLKINANTSNVADFLAALPQKILYSGSIDLNPGGVGNQNFITKDSKVSVGLEVNLPLEITADNMKLEQTIEDLDLSAENPDFIEELTLYFRTISDFPFDIDLKLSFLDSITGLSNKDLDIRLTESPEIDPVTLKSENKVTTDTPLNFKDDDIDALLAANKLKITAILNTPVNANNEKQVVKLFTDYSLEIKIAAQTKMNFQPFKKD